MIIFLVETTRSLGKQFSKLEGSIIILPAVTSSKKLHNDRVRSCPQEVNKLHNDLVRSCPQEVIRIGFLGQCEVRV